MRLFLSIVLSFLVTTFGVRHISAQSQESAGEKEEPPRQSEANESASGAGLRGPHHDVMVTATRTPTELKKVGQVVTLITREEIEARGAHTVAHLLNTVPGISVSRVGSFGGATSVFVRGGESDFNLVMIDGVKINQPGGTFDFGDLTTANVERIEIVRGPSSVLYGASAASSVINIVTRRGEGLPSGVFRVEGGSHGSFGFLGTVDGGAERVEYSLGVSADRTEGLYELNNAYRNTDFSARTGFNVNPSTVFTGMVRYSDSYLQLPTDFTGAPVDPNDFRRSESAVYSAAIRTRLAESYETQLQYGYSRGSFRTLEVRDDIVDFFDSTFHALHNRQQLDWQNDVRLAGHNLMTAGLAYEREESETENLDRRSLGLYIQDQVSWDDKLFVTAGFRYDDNNRFEDFTTANVSLGWLIHQSMKVRGSLGRGVRAPAFFEVFGIPDFNIQGNPNLRPEKNTAVDFGLDYTPTGQRFGISATGFLNRFQDLIEFTFLADPGAANYFNVEAARSRGLELEWYATFQSGLLLGGQYTLTDTLVTDSGQVPGGSFEEGQSLLRRPRNMASAFAEFDWKKSSVRFDVRWKGKRDDVQFFPDFSSQRVVLSSYWKLDLTAKVPLAGIRDSTGMFDLVLRAENLLDRQYTEIAGFQSVGRSLWAGIQFGF